MKPPLFSIVCSVKNARSFIHGCIDSILAQDDPHFEVIVQDGGSTDGTLEILRAYGNRIDLVSRQDDGPEQGFFAALDRIRGELWCACLADERLMPGALCWARTQLAAHPALGAVYGDQELLVLATGERRAGPAPEFSLEAFLLSRLTLPFSACFFRTAATRGIDARRFPHSGEWQFWLRFLAGHEIAHFPGAVSVFGYRPDAASNRVDVLLASLEPRQRALEAFLRETSKGRNLAALRDRAIRGILIDRAHYLLRVHAGDAVLALLGSTGALAAADATDLSGLASITAEELAWCLQQGTIEPAAELSRALALVSDQNPAHQRLMRIMADLLGAPADEIARLEAGYAGGGAETPVPVADLLRHGVDQLAGWMASLGVRPWVVYGAGTLGRTLVERLAALGRPPSHVLESHASASSDIASVPVVRPDTFFDAGAFDITGVLTTFGGDEPGAVIPEAAARLRRQGIPVLSWQDFAFLKQQPVSIYARSSARR